MVQKKRLVLFISAIASATASAVEITKVEYTGIRTEFAREYADLFEQEPCPVWKQDCSNYPAHGYCGDHGCPSRNNHDRGSNKSESGGGGKSGGNKSGGNNGGNGGSKGAEKKK